MKRPAVAIAFHFQKRCTLRDRKKLRAAIADAFHSYKTPLSSLNIIFCSDEFLLDINRNYLQHDYYTDIITFNLAEQGAPVEGEIYISVDRINENAQSVGASFNHELHRVTFHGVLHLCGFNDHSAVERAGMTEHENKLLRRYFVPRGKRGVSRRTTTKNK
jgi:probable rRNA maturation factor